MIERLAGRRLSRSYEDRQEDSQSKRHLNFTLHPSHFPLPSGRYVGAEDIEADAEPFAEKYPRLVAEVEECFKEGERLSKLVMANLEDVGYGS